MRGGFTKKDILEGLHRGEEPLAIRRRFLTNLFDRWQREHKFEPSTNDDNRYKTVESFMAYLKIFHPEFPIDWYEDEYYRYYQAHLKNCTLALKTDYLARRSFSIEEFSGYSSQIPSEWAADSIMQFVIEVDEAMTDWLVKWQKLLDEALKENRKNKLGGSTIEAMLAGGLRGTDIGYIIGRSVKYATVIFRLGSKQQMRVDISYAKFAEQLPLAIESAKKLNELAKIATNSIQVGMLKRGSYWGNKPVYDWTEPEKDGE